MKVSSKIIAGFLALMLLAFIVVANPLTAIHQMQAVNRDLSLSVKSVTKVFALQAVADPLGNDSKKYFAGLDPFYEQQMMHLRDEFLEDLGDLRETASSEPEQAQLVKLREALDDLLLVFNTLKQQNKAWDLAELPPDLTLAINHFQAQTDIMLDTVQVALKDRIAAAAEAGTKAERLAWTVGVFALLLGVVVAGLIVRSI